MEAYPMPSTAIWSDVAWNGNIYCAVTSDASGKSATSTDGINWTLNSMPQDSFHGIAWNGSVFCAVSQSHSSGYPIHTSPDGITWTGRSGYTAFHSVGIVSGGGIFVSADDNGGGMYSLDGITWTTSSLPGGYHRRIAYNGSIFCVVESSGSYVYTSSNGIDWVQRTLPISLEWFDISSNLSRFCIVSTLPSSICLISDDGITWQSCSIPHARYYKIESNDNFFCAPVSWNVASTAAISRDGVLWENISLPVAGNWTASGTNGKDILLMSSTHVVVLSEFYNFWTNFKGQTEIL